MPVTTDIVASYRGPRAVMRRLLAMGPNEGRALAILLAGCAVTFIGQWPRLAREAHLNERDLNQEMAGALMAWLILAPLVFYALAFVSHLALRALGGANDAYAARLALFWSWLAASPLLLLNGLVAGFVGPGPAQTGVGALWLAVFLWFWLSALHEAGRTGREAR
ncbi:MAG: YIP1 family protein [Roseovarius sp.]|nr:YIP1 family protein [Roseovarius sp.]